MRHLDQATITRLLQRWAEVHVAASATVSEAWSMPGNAGLSFGFDAFVDAGVAMSGSTLSHQDGRVPLVIRLAPPGVRRSGNTDVLRQVPLLEALRASDIPVATVIWSTSDEASFGTDAFIQERLDALPLHMTEATLSAVTGEAELSPYIRQAVGALASIHSVGWSSCLPDWEPPRSVDAELTHWHSLLSRSEKASWIDVGGQLARSLVAHQPRDPRMGLLHGDFQTNNVLYDRAGTLRAVVDWELAGIGPQLLDLGWLAMFCDANCWTEPYASQMRVRVPPLEVRDFYEAATGRRVDRFAWYQAFACYRFGAISAFNVRLHRTGKRLDPSWEDKVTSIPRLFERGLELIASEDRRQ